MHDVWQGDSMGDAHVVLLLGMSRYQKFSSRYQYQWNSTILDTQFDTTVKNKTINPMYFIY